MEYRGVVVPTQIIQQLAMGEVAYLVRTSPNGQELIMSQEQFDAEELPIFSVSRFSIQTDDDGSYWLVDESTETIDTPCRWPLPQQFAKEGELLC